MKFVSIAVSTLAMAMTLMTHRSYAEPASWPLSYDDLDELFDGGEIAKIDDFDVDYSFYSFGYRYYERNRTRYYKQVTVLLNERKYTGSIFPSSMSDDRARDVIRGAARRGTLSHLKSLEEPQLVRSFWNNRGCLNRFDFKSVMLESGLRIVVQRINTLSGCADAIAIPYAYSFFVPLQPFDEAVTTRPADLYLDGEVVGQVGEGEQYTIKEIDHLWVLLMADGSELPGWVKMDSLRQLD